MFPLLAEAVAPELVGQGAVATAAIAAIAWLIRHYTGEIKEITTKFEAAISRKDDQIISEGRRRDETCAALNREMVEAVKDVGEALTEVRRAVEHLTDRVEAAEREARFRRERE